MSDKVEEARVLGQLSGLETTEETPSGDEGKSQEELDAAQAEADRIAAEAAGGEGNEEGDGEESSEGNEEGSEEGDEEQSVAEHFISRYEGLEVELGDIDPNSVEAIDKVIEALEPIQQVKGVNKLFEAYPEVQGLFSHLQQGLSIDSWKATVAPAVWEKFEIKDKDEDTAVRVIKEAARVKGLSEKQTERLITMAKDDATLVEEAKEELKFLQRTESESRKAIVEKEKEAIAAEQAKQQQVWKQAEELATQGKFAGINLDPKDAKEFYQALAYRGKSGKEETEVDKAWKDISVEEELAVNWFLVNLKKGAFKDGFKNSKVVNKVKPINRTKAKVTGAESGAGESTMSLEQLKNLK